MLFSVFIWLNIVRAYMYGYFEGCWHFVFIFGRFYGCVTFVLNIYIFHF